MSIFFAKLLQYLFFDFFHLGVRGPTLFLFSFFINATLAGKSGRSVPLQTGLGSFTTTTEKIVGNFHSLNMTTDAHLSSPVHSPCGSPSHSSIQDKSHSQGNYGVGLWLGSRRNGGMSFILTHLQMCFWFDVIASRKLDFASSTCLKPKDNIIFFEWDFNIKDFFWNPLEVCTNGKKKKILTSEQILKSFLSREHDACTTRILCSTESKSHIPLITFLFLLYCWKWC